MNITEIKNLAQTERILLTEGTKDFVMIIEIDRRGNSQSYFATRKENKIFDKCSNIDEAFHYYNEYT